MCGILGYCSPSGQPAPFALDAALRIMRHRGPDDSGTFASPHCQLGMTRLAIIDLTSGRQPLTSADGRHTIVFNGELYNYRELREELLRAGIAFRTQSDTEVILEAFRAYGVGMMARLDGMFALAIWDSVRRECFLARDRCGIKPLYYSEHGGNLYFASEFKVLAAMLPRRLPPDPRAMALYLSYGYVPSPHSPWTGVAKLAAAHWRQYDRRGAATQQCYWQWDLSAADRQQWPAPGEAVAAVEVAVRNAVRRELTASDVPVGIALSGGIDSTAIALAASRTVGAGVRTFCFGFPESSHDEAKDAQLVAATLATDHTTFRFGPAELQEGLMKMRESLDEPFADPTYLTLLLLSRQMRQQVKVALTGMGGDEVFTGYPTLRAHRWSAGYRMLPAGIRGLLRKAVDLMPPSEAYFGLEFKARRFTRTASAEPIERHVRWMEYFTPEERARLSGPALPRELLAAPDVFARETMRNCASDDPMQRVLYFDFHTFLENMGMYQVDRASMAYGLEFRVPLLNREVIELLARMPMDVKMYRGEAKYLLRRMVAPAMPAAIMRKPKKGFAPPVQRWLKTVFSGTCHELLAPERVRRNPFLNPETVAQLLAENDRGRRDHSRGLWGLMMLQLWMERYA